MLRRSLSMIALAAIAGTAAVVSAAPANALSASSIVLSALSVNQGSPIGVKVDYLWLTSKCTMRLTGAGSTKPTVVTVRNNSVKASLKTTGLPVGKYTVAVNCGKGNQATSAPFTIVPKGAATTATCDITENGFSASAQNETAYGAVVTNRSTALGATSVQLSIAFKDAAGTTLATESEYAQDIPPGQSVLIGGSAKATGVSSITVSALCKSTTDPVIAKLRGQAQSIAARDSDFYPTTASGQFANTTGFVLSGSSTMDFITRNAAGQITGGGSTYPDAFVPVGATGTWSDIMEMFPGQVASLEWVMAPRQAS